MKLTKDELKKLKDTWYKKLSDNGFKDIEKEKNDESILTQTAGYCYRKTDSFLKEIKEEYYIRISQIANDDQTFFKNDAHKYVLLMHSEGLRIKDICYELEIKGMSRDRKNVRLIIRRYEMSWGLRFYTDKQLHKKAKHGSYRTSSTNRTG